MRTSKLQKETIEKFVHWAVSQIEVERKLYAEADNQLELDELAEVEYGLRLVCDRAGMLASKKGKS